MSSLLHRIAVSVLACLLAAGLPAATAANAPLQAEAFLDDAGLAPGTGTPLALDGASTDALRIAAGALDLTGIDPGPHTVYVRVRDTAGVWSAPVGQSLDVTPGNPGGVLPGGDNQIEAAEAFVDVDPGEGNGTELPVARDGAIDSSVEALGGSVSLDGLSLGAHVIYVRFLDSTGIWSPVTAQTFFVPDFASGPGGVVTLLSAEGSVDGGPAIVLAADDGAFDDLVETVTLNEAVAAGYHSARIRFLDSQGLWGDSTGERPPVPPLGATGLSGRVTDAGTGLAVPDVQVWVGGGYGGRSDANGFYAIPSLPTGTFPIATYKSSYLMYSGSVTVSGPVRLDIPLVRDFSNCTAGTLSGVVTDVATGAPKTGVTIRLDNGWTATSGPTTGAYAFSNVPAGVRTVSVSVAGYVAYNQKVALCGGTAYSIALTPKTIPLGSAFPSGKSADPVNTATGNYIFERTDLKIPGIGFGFAFERSYNSQDPQPGPLGFGWTHNLNASLTTDAGGNATIRWGDGGTETYAPDGAGGYVPQFGVFDTLTKEADGSWTLEKKNDQRFAFDAAGKLQAIVDRNGNAQTLTYAGGRLMQVTDTAGREIDFAYDGTGRIERIEDPLGRAVLFAYDGAGDLISSTDLRGGVTHYTYDGEHQILTATDPRTNVFVRNTYDAARRVVSSQKDAKGAQTDYVYDEVNRKTTITDPLDNITTHYHDDKMRLIQETDARGGSAIYVYDEAGNRTDVMDKNGNLTQYGYDARGNVTSKRDALGNVTKIAYDADDNPRTRTDALNKVTRFDYDANGNLTKTTDALNQVTEITYWPNGLPETVKDPRGNVTTNSYDAAGNLIQVTDALGKVTTHTYDSVGRRRSTTDPLLRATAFEYDKNDNLTLVTDANGKQTLHTYDENDSKTGTTDRNGNLTQWSYDEKDLLIGETDALNQTETYTYDALDRRLTRTDRRGFTTHYAYDAVGNLTEVTDALGRKTTYTYDLNGNRLSMTDARSNTTGYQYDALNRQTRVTDALLNAVVTTYDALGRVKTITAPGGRVTHNTYDELGRLKEAKDPEGGVTLYSYDANGNREKVTDPEGHLTQYGYDKLNRLEQVTDALGHTQQIAYDDAGNRKRVTDALGHATTYTYDKLNRLVKETDAENNTTTTAYDAGGRVTSSTDAAGKITRFAYDSLDRLKKVTDAANGTVQYTYDNNGNRLTMTDPRAKVTRYAYDKLNRRIRMTEPLGHITVFEYDEVGNLARKTDPKLQVTQYSYDVLNRRTGIDYPAQPDVTFTYDAVGNLQAMTDGLGTTTHTYDLLNRRTGTTDPFGKVVGYGYDKNGNRKTLTYPANKTVAYVYDAANRMTTVTDWLGNVNTYGYDNANRLTDTFNANGTTTAYGYDDANRFIGLTNAKSDATVINAYSYVLDPVGNHLSEERTEPLAPVIPTGTVDDTHDAENRLTASNGVPNVFDANGNMTAKGVNTYAYDAADRLVQTGIGGVFTQYGYDGLGNRYRRTRGGVETRFVLDTNTSLTNVLMETDAAGNALAYNVFGQGLIERILPNDSVRQYHYDSRGSTIAVTDAAGTVVQKYAYDPFGRVVNANGAGGNPFGFLGRYGVVDEGDDLSFIRARYYDSEKQRFVSKDVKQGSARINQSHNRYAYATNNPVILIDFSGFNAKEAVTTDDGVMNSPTNTAAFVDSLIRNAGTSPASSLNLALLNIELERLGGDFILGSASEISTQLLEGYIQNRLWIEAVKLRDVYQFKTASQTVTLATKALPAGMLFLGGGIEYLESRASGCDQYESAARASLSIGVHSLLSVATVPLSATGAGAAAGVAMHAWADTLIVDTVYEGFVQPTGKALGDYLYDDWGMNNADYNPAMDTYNQAKDFFSDLF